MVFDQTHTRYDFKLPIQIVKKKVPCFRGITKLTNKVTFSDLLKQKCFIDLKTDEIFFFIHYYCPWYSQL